MKRLIPILLFISISCYSQRITEDTVFVNFSQGKFSNNQFSISTVNDLRTDKEISTISRRKYILLPVDYYVMTVPRVDSAIITLDSQAKKDFHINLLNFYISERKGNFSSTLVLESKIAVYEHKADSEYYVGQLLYQNEYKKHKASEKYQVSYSNMLGIWQTDFYRDMNSITVAGAQSYFVLPNLFPEKKVRDLFLNLNVSSAFGTDWWLADVEFYFTPPEIKSRNVYIANVFRYQNQPKFESFAYGWKSEHLQYRLNNFLAFDGSANILLGINKWKHFKEMKPGIEQIFNLNASFTQALALKTIKSPVYGKAGIMENMFYIYHFGFKFEPGLYFTLGTRF